MSDIQVGDEVSRNLVSGHPTGVVKEMKASGKLEIQSNSKLINENADENNPAVHVEQEGDGVVKRPSELEPLEGNVQTSGEAAVQEGGEHEAQKKTTRGGGRGGRKTSAETRRKQSEAGKKGGAATAAKKAGKRKQGKVASEDAAVGEKREREGVVEEKGEKESEDINMEKGERDRVQVKSVTAEQEKAEKAAGKKAKKAKVSHERPDDEHVPGKEPEQLKEGATHEGTKLAEPTEPTPTAAGVTGVSAELKDLERDNRNLGLDVGAAGAEPRRAAETASESMKVATSVERMEAATTSQEASSAPSEKKRGSKKGATRGKAAA